MYLQGTFDILDATAALMRREDFKIRANRKQLNEQDTILLKKTADILKEIIDDKNFSNNPSSIRDSIKDFTVIYNNLEGVCINFPQKIEKTKQKNAKQKKIKLKINAQIIRTLSNLSLRISGYVDTAVTRGTPHIADDLHSTRSAIVRRRFQNKYNVDLVPHVRSGTRRVEYRLPPGATLDMQFHQLVLGQNAIVETDSIIRKVFSLNKLRPNSPDKDLMSAIFKEALSHIEKLEEFSMNGAIENENSSEDECKMSRSSSHGSVSTKSTASNSSTPMEISVNSLSSTPSSRESISSKSTSSTPTTPPKVSVIPENSDEESVGPKTVSHAERRSMGSRKSVVEEEERPKSANGKSEIRDIHFFDEKPPVHFTYLNP
jgi:hypothetical protein